MFYFLILFILIAIFFVFGSFFVSKLWEASDKKSLDEYLKNEESETKAEKEKEKLWKKAAYFICPKCNKKSYFKDMQCLNCKKKTIFFDHTDGVDLVWGCNTCDYSSYVYCPNCDCSIKEKFIRSDVKKRPIFL